MANRKHLAILKQGVDAWNALREDHPEGVGKPSPGEPTLAASLFKEIHRWETWGADLSEADLNGADLREANLSETRLTKAVLTGARLHKADLRKADLSKADLSKADLKKANLSSAHISCASLSETTLSEAILTRAYLHKADLRKADLSKADLSKADLSEANLTEANLTGADLRGANLNGAVLGHTLLNDAELREAKLIGLNLSEINLSKKDLRNVDIREANLERANLVEANLTGAKLDSALLQHADLSKAKLSKASLVDAALVDACLIKATLIDANLIAANLMGANLTGANLTGANLAGALMIKANLTQANLNSCTVYGVSVWNPKMEGVQQSDLVITSPEEPTVTVDNLEMAQFVYLLLKNDKIRDVIDTIGRKGVLILGRFSERKPILEAIRTAIRNRKLLPIVFDFERPTDRDFSETVMTLAGMSRFIIADITKPRSVPLELELTVPNYMIPFVPIIKKGEHPFAMFRDLWQKHRDWVLDPLYYDSVERLIQNFDKAVIEPVNTRHRILAARKAEELATRSLDDYE